MNFFKKLTILRLIINLYGLQVSRSLKTYKAIKLGIKCTNFFSPDLVFTSECPHYIFMDIVFKFHMHVHDFSKKYHLH